MHIYKEGHGVLIRRTAFVSLGCMAVWGGMALYDGLMQFKTFQSLTLSDYQIPVLGQRADLAALICWSLVAFGVWRAFRFLNAEKSADFLIEADTEFRKITWPTWNDALNSALVVLVFVVIMTLLIAVCDMILSFVLRQVLQ